MLVVDDSTRWMSVFFLKTKDQAAAAFAKYKAVAENNSGNLIKVVRSDRGGEFLSTAFKSICEGAGIDRQFTTPYSHNKMELLRGGIGQLWR